MVEDFSDCKTASGESGARQQRLVVCEMALVVRKMRRARAEQSSKWRKWKRKSVVWLLGVS